MNTQTRPPTPETDANIPPHRYTGKRACEIERRWQQEWEAKQTFITPGPGDDAFDPDKPRYFVLDMFPYPSGAGLHVGHPEGYTATDIVARFKRMQGHNVLHPMGFDAFGLPAEQYAISTGVHPAITTRKAIDTFRAQLKRFGFSYDWSREFATIDEDYYRWTQWIWLRAYHSWFDPQAQKARPIEDLIQRLENGEAYIGPGAELVQGGVAGDIEALGGEPVGMRKWHELTEDERRAFIDSHRLVYLGEQTVNWCPRLGTVLANEEVIDGKSERGGFPVHRQPLRQWMFRITAYADRLLADLEPLDWPESTRAQQREWIGRSEGAEIDFPLHRVATTLRGVDEREPTGDGETERHDHPQAAERNDHPMHALRVFTTRPDTIFGATYMVVAPEHPLIDDVIQSNAKRTSNFDPEALRDYVQQARNRSDIERQESREKTGVFTGVHATNPATGENIPVWCADYVLVGYGTGAIMAVPGQDQRDWEFAQAFDLPIVRTVQPPDDFEGDAYLGDGPAINSANDQVSLNGLDVDDAKARIIDWLEETGIGRRRVNYKLRDWLFSRQRYWGEPFPIVFDEDGYHYPVDEASLPVRLPELDDYKPIDSDTPKPPLAKATNWVHTTAGEAGVADGVLNPDTPVTRETNTMPGWAGSCWYYLRYCDPNNDEQFISPERERYWMLSNRKPRAKNADPDSHDSSFDPDRHHIAGVDLYIGGSEHAVLHLLYARFWHKILFDLGYVSTPEPMGRLFHQGMIVSHAYQREDGSLVPIDEVDEVEEDSFIERATKKPVTQVTAKMSKSLKNVVNPDDIIAEYGADCFRLYEMYLGPLEATKPWNTRDMIGLFRFLQRVWRLAVDEDTGEIATVDQPDETVERQLHRTIARVEHDIDRLAFNTAIAAMIEFVNVATATGGVTNDQMERFTLILAPFAPHIAEELWYRLGHGESLAYEAWPGYNDILLSDETIELPVQIAGKVRAKINVSSDADQTRIEQAALADHRVQQALGGKPVRKVIVVPGRIVNIVT